MILSIRSDTRILGEELANHKQYGFPSDCEQKHAETNPKERNLLRRVYRRSVLRLALSELRGRWINVPSVNASDNVNYTLADDN